MLLSQCRAVVKIGTSRKLNVEACCVNVTTPGPKGRGFPA
jgi:hypothetical protein